MKNPLRKIPIPFLIVGTWISIGVVAFHHLEGWTWAQSFYYAVITLTTVGYGDFTPTSDVSRVVAALYILIGVTVVLGSLGYIGTHYIEYRQRLRKK